jgi:hypothetical protein
MVNIRWGGPGGAAELECQRNAPLYAVVFD